MTEISETCKHLKSQLSSYIDGELDDSICNEIEKHLAGCEKCQIVIDTLRKTVVLYREAPEEILPPAVHTRLIKVLELEAKKKEL
jgi:anti-sigma factor RsiW